ncbi:MAG: PolC-type DNA polymerase III [Eubacterium sp.]|nr:PolC-type DNA polymerase III [Eubacterium sp.]
MNERPFYDVFPDIQLSQSADRYLRDTMVTRIVMYREKQRMEIYLESTHLIDKEILLQAEEELRVFLFGPTSRFDVKIRERFLLSGQYTPEKLWELYMPSFLYELSRKNHVAYRLIKRGEVRMTDQILRLTLSNTELARSREKEIRDFFEQAFLTRFGMSISVSFSYTIAVQTDLLKAAEEAAAADAVSPGAGKDASSTEDGAAETGAAKSKASGRDTGNGRTTAKRNPRGGNAPAGRMENGKKKGFNRASDPDCIFGRDVEGDIVPISSLTQPSLGEVCVLGQVISIEEKETRSGNFLLLCMMTDDTDTIGFKIFRKPEDKDVFLEEFKKGGFYKLKGTVDYDSFSRELGFMTITGIKPAADFRTVREDGASEKRVELHLHTGFSESDSVLDVEKAIKRAVSWGMNAMAITDHAVVQAFPVANHAIPKGSDFKVIYGVEGYFVDDTLNLTMNGHGETFDEKQEYVVFDIETTGLSMKRCKIIEIGAVRVDAYGNEIGRFSEFINPEEPIPYEITLLTSITDDMVMNAPNINVILPKFLEFAKDAILVAHNATFDTGFIQENCSRLGLPYPFTALDTMTLSYVLLPQLGRYTLDRLCKHFGVVNAHHHRACDDADVTAKIFVSLMKMMHEAGIHTVEELDRRGHESVDAIHKAHTFHGTILVKNETGRVNLYRLISDSHIKYFNRFPRIPLSEIEKHREGLLLGTACERGQLYQALLDGRSDAEIARIVSFYDYLEIQPTSNNRHLIDDSKVAAVQSEEDLRDLNKRIIALGKEFGKPVVATGDVHFLDPEDAAFRTIIQEGSKDKGPKKDKEVRLIPIAEGESALSNEMLRQPPLYFRTTEEMLAEFDYLDPDLAKEIVIDNSNRIADMIERISPVRPDKCPPVIENSDRTLREICENKAHEIYGPELPPIVSERLNKELDSIINNGYSVMYIIAQKLVWKSNADGYLVGSRGSVGSSFAATMAGITEVNPLSPHYICPECHFVDFDSEEVKAYSGMSGCDMPDRDCPKCGHKLIKEGHDIPFETFLGFKGDKEPDIDLNFSGDYQPRAHAFIGEMFGEDHAFRAGTITTYAEKTVFGYIKGFCERRGISMRQAEMDRIVQHCLGVKRSTGQHPGGIIVTPDTEEIYSFTPVQKPANDQTSDQVTTHFEYHSIDHNLLKFDILGHDDPTMIRRLEDLTGLDAKTVPLDDKKVMSLFHGTEALGITPEDIDGTPLGALGIPEFGTDFAMQMVIDADPQNFSDLVRISGLSHGTDVWLGNAKDLIQAGTCKLSSAICCRDDIMVYLMHMGLPSGDAFSIMENVRKGKVASGKCDKWGGWKDMIAEHDVPEWYMGSCEKIKYMFPKAHAVAYVMMGWRVAYFKVYHPLAYYAAFFSIRAKAFSYETMCQGRERLDRELHRLQHLEKFEKTAKDDDSIRDMRIVQEMYARGLEFMPIDIYRADDRYFQVIDGKIMPSFSSIDGMGETAATQLKEAAKDGLFLSQEELKSRAKLSGTVIETMAKLGILGDMPKTGQLQFTFD